MLHFDLSESRFGHSGFELSMVSIWTRFVEEAGHDLGLGMVVGLDLDNGFVFSFAEPVHRVKGLCDRPKPTPHLDVQHIEDA